MDKRLPPCCAGVVATQLEREAVVELVVGSWRRVDNMTYANEMVTDSGLRIHLTLERLPVGGWDWTVWREDRPEDSRYGVAADPAAGFAAAERAGHDLVGAA